MSKFVLKVCYFFIFILIASIKNSRIWTKQKYFPDSDTSKVSAWYSKKRLNVLILIVSFVFRWKICLHLDTSTSPSTSKRAAISTRKVRAFCSAILLYAVLHFLKTHTVCNVLGKPYSEDLEIRRLLFKGVDTAFLRVVWTKSPAMLKQCQGEFVLCCALGLDKKLMSRNQTTSTRRTCSKKSCERWQKRLDTQIGATLKLKILKTLTKICAF